MRIDLKVWKTLAIVAALLPALGLVSCSNDDETPDYKIQSKVKFVLKDFSENRAKFADEVGSVALYVFDERDLFVKVFEDAGSRLSQDDYTLTIEGLNPGTYSCVAWCGLKDDDDKVYFSVSDMKAGVTTRQEMLCRMAVKSVEGEAQSSADLNDLFYGTIDRMVISDKGEEQVPIYTVDLIQDTKEIEIIIKSTSETHSLKASDFSFYFEDANATLGYDNKPVGIDKVVYTPYSVEEKQLNGENGKSVVAKIKVNRLMADSKGILSIYDSSRAKPLFVKVPLVDYILMYPGYTDPNGGDRIYNQDILDKYNEFSLTFFNDNDYPN